MVIYLGADHRGFALKESLKAMLHNEGYEIVDCGDSKLNPDDDYTDFALDVARRVGATPDQSRGVLICGSGVGMDVAANKIARVRSCLAFSSDQVVAARSHDAVNVVSLAADFIQEDDAFKIVKSFLATPFDRQRNHIRRLEKIAQVEENH